MAGRVQPLPQLQGGGSLLKRELFAAPRSRGGRHAAEGSPRPQLDVGQVQVDRVEDFVGGPPDLQVAEEARGD